MIASGRNKWQWMLGQFIVSCLFYCNDVDCYNGAKQKILQSKQQAQFKETKEAIAWIEEEYNDDDFGGNSNVNTVEESNRPKQLLRLDLLNLRKNNNRANNDHQRTQEQVEQHLLRTNKWRFCLNWRKKGWNILPSLKGSNYETLQIDFNSNGYARISDSCNSTNQCISYGRWELTQHGKLILSIPYTNKVSKYCQHKFLCHSDEISSTVFDELIFTGDIHLNPFGLQPKLTRGFVTLSKQCDTWHRPIVATFSASGIGKDTADFSYQSRD